MAGVPGGISAVEIAQQSLKEQQGPQAKEGPSKFDRALEAKGPTGANEVGGADKVGGPREVTAVNDVHQADALGRVQKTGAEEKVLRTQMSLPSDPVAQKSEVNKTVETLTGMLSDMERGQGVMDKLLAQATSGKEFSNTELIALQAGMYKYTQEMELTGKVVEKATNGLKETLKTQV